MGSDTLKPGWTRVAFGDVVRLSAARAPDPEAAGFARYVGLEHLDPGDLTIRRWGDVAAGTTFTSVFRPGHVLFGKRRAYQRKVAVPDFGGVCSGDIYVFESTSEHHLLPDLLPFICQTEGFFEHAIGTSAGSLSPRTNWKSLAAYEFALPPLDEQRRIAEVLTAITTVSQLHEQAAASAETVTETFLLRHLKGEHLGSVVCDEHFGEYSEKLPLTPIGHLLTDTQYGLSKPAVTGGKFRMLRMMDLADGVAVDSDSCLVDLSMEEFNRYRLDHGDVLFNRTNSHELVGRTGVYKLAGNHVFASYLIRLKTKTDRILPDYLCAFLNAPVGRRQVMRCSTRAVSQTNVSASNLRTVLTPLPPLNDQRRVIEYGDHLREACRAHRQRAKEAAGLASGVMNDMLRFSR